MLQLRLFNCRDECWWSRELGDTNKEKVIAAFVKVPQDDRLALLDHFYQSWNLCFTPEMVIQIITEVYKVDPDMSPLTVRLVSILLLEIVRNYPKLSLASTIIYKNVMDFVLKANNPTCLLSLGDFLVSLSPNDVMHTSSEEMADQRTAATKIEKLLTLGSAIAKVYKALAVMGSSSLHCQLLRNRCVDIIKEASDHLKCRDLRFLFGFGNFFKITDWTRIVCDMDSDGTEVFLDFLVAVKSGVYSNVLDLLSNVSLLLLEYRSINPTVSDKASAVALNAFHAFIAQRLESLKEYTVSRVSSNSMNPDIVNEIMLKLARIYQALGSKDMEFRSFSQELSEMCAYNVERMVTKRYVERSLSAINTELTEPWWCSSLSRHIRLPGTKSVYGLSM